MDASMELTKILRQMSEITRMRRGKLTEQYNRKKDEDGRERQWGPYYTLQAWIDGKNRSERVRREDASQVRDDIRGYEQFSELSGRYVEVAERMTRDQVADSKKKPLRSRRHASARPKRPST